MLLEDLLFFERYTKELFSFLPFAVLYLNPIGVILEANETMEKMSSYKIEDLIAEDLEFIFDKKDYYGFWMKGMNFNLDFILVVY